MDVTMEKTDNVSACFTVSVKESDYAEKVIKDLKEIGKTHMIPGFRKGHVSIDQLRRRFGKQVKSDVINQNVYDAVIKYIQDNKIGILGEPMPVEIKEINLVDKDYTFQYEIAIAPEINVVLDKKVSLPYYKIEVSQEMIDNQDQMYRERYGAQVQGETVEPKALVKGSIATLNEEGMVKEGEDAITIAKGIVFPMYFKSTDERDKFMGKKVNDKIVFNPWKAYEGNVAEIASLLNIDKDKAANVTGDVEMTITEIVVVKPAELNQEYFDSIFGKDKVKTEEEYFQQLKEMIASQLSGQSEMLFRMTTERQLVKKYGNVELPQKVLKKWLLRRNDGLTEENIDAEFDKMIPSLKWQLIKERIAAATDMKIEEEDVFNHAKSVAANQFAQYGMTNVDDEMLADYAKRILADKNSRQRIIEDVGDIKLFDVIKGAAKLNEKIVSMDEFREIASKG